MSIAATDIKLQGHIYEELNPGSGISDCKFYDNCNAYAWAQGPPPGNNTVSDWQWGVKSGVNQDILHGPYSNGVTAGRISNYKFSDFKNSYGYMDQANYVIDMFIQNLIPPAGRGNPPNDVIVDMGLYDQTLTSNSICAIFGNAQENGGTFGPIDVSQSFTFNVEYFYVSGGVSNQGFNPYNLEIYVNSNFELALGGAGSQAVDYTMFGSLPQNNGNGFTVEFYFA